MPESAEAKLTIDRKPVDKDQPGINGDAKRRYREPK